MTLIPGTGLPFSQISTHLTSSRAADCKELLDPLRMWQLIDRWRADAAIGVLAPALIEVNLSWMDSAVERTRIVQSLQQYAARNWIHAFEQGWLSHCSFAILLPSATAEEAVVYAEQLSNSTTVPMSAMTIFSTGHLGPPCRVRSIMTGSLHDRAVKPRRLSKRCLDLMLGGLFFILALPLLLICGLLIRISSPGPMLFRQQRIGLGGRRFWMYKLRTMRDGAESERVQLVERNQQTGLAFKVVDDPRVTRIGRLLRRTSLDELPQLWNVLRGEMSLVGPRPLPASDWNPQEGWYALRHDVLPGITCHWQVSGRAHIPFDEWMRMDLEYIRRDSLWNDLVILAKTIPAVLTQHGAA